MNRAARMARLSVVSNTFLIGLKVVVGILSGSVSIISEAIHSFMDLAAAVMAFFSIRIAQRPADQDHPYGHEKVENVSGVIEAALILAAAALIVYESVRKLLHPAPLEHVELGVAVMLVSGLVNAVVSRVLFRVARAEGSVALEADALHLKTDVYSSVGVGAGLAVILVLERFAGASWAPVLDPVVATVIAAVIAVEAWKMLRRAFAPLIDQSLPPAELAAVRACVARHAPATLHAVRSRRAGVTRHVDFHLVLPAGMSVRDSHGLCDAIEADLQAVLPNTSVMIHIEPDEEGR